MQPSRRIAAVVWDFDGTLVDSRAKNREVTLKILPRITSRSFDTIPALKSQETYDDAVERSHDWRELYRREFGLSAAETEKAGALWEDEHLTDDSLSPFFDGILDVVHELPVPQAVVSQNTSRLIAQTFERAGVNHHFKPIIGHEEVPEDSQKPHPRGLMMCLHELGLLHRAAPPARVLYIGDHEVDMLCVQQANVALEAQGVALRTESVRVGWGPTHWVPGPTPAHWHADTPAKVLEIVDGLARRS